MTSERTQQQIAVIGPKGQRAIVIAVPNPSRSPMDDEKVELIYGLGGLVVDKISEHEFRDFQGTIWTIEAAASNS